ncbi:MAG: class I adenylate-forming enzyme family protein [Paracoccaceae bacterium]
MNLGLWLKRQAMAAPMRPALFRGVTQIADYRRFDQIAMQLSGWLVDHGVRPGDRVALFMKNVPDYLMLLYGIWYAGAVAVPINAKLHGREAAFILNHSESSLVFATEADAARLIEASCSLPIIDISVPQLSGQSAGPIVSRNAEDLAWLFYTSGTTGRPKGVKITHGMLKAMALSYHADVDTVSAEDAAIYAAPLSHGAGLYALVHVQVGARHVLPASGGFDPAEVLDLAAKMGRVHMFAAPTMVGRLTRHAQAAGDDGRGLRTIVYGGGPMYQADLLAALDTFGPIFVQIYGQGECPMAITSLSRADIQNRNHPDWKSRIASVGRAQSCVEIAIGGPDGQSLPAGATGEVMVRGAPVMPGYWRDPEGSAQTLKDGWLMTGDVGTLDDAGYLTLIDRSKDVIISGGSNVYPREVEEILLQHPDVQEASVIGQPHPGWGEEVVAFVVSDASDKALDDLCRNNIARFKAPKRYIRVPELPKNNYGKVLKTTLRDWLRDA